MPFKRTDCPQEIQNRYNNKQIISIDMMPNSAIVVYVAPDGQHNKHFWTKKENIWKIIHSEGPNTKPKEPKKPRLSLKEIIKQRDEQYKNPKSIPILHPADAQRLRNSCLRKIKYREYADALAAMTRMDCDTLNIYKCSNCTGYHIGNKFKKNKQLPVAQPKPKAS